MAEAYSVESRLNVTTNVDAVLSKLIETFEKFDERVKASEDILKVFDEQVSKSGESPGGLGNAFKGLKLPEGLVADLQSLVTNGRAFATSSTEAAKAWREIADASKSIRNPPAPPAGGAGGGNNGGTGGAGGGGGRGSGGRRGGGGGSDDGDGPTLFGTEDDYGHGHRVNDAKDLKEGRANAVWQDQDFNARSRFQSKLMADEQAAVLKEIAAREKIEAERNKQERDLMNAEQRVILSEIAAREKVEESAVALAEAQSKAAAALNERARGDKGGTYGPLPYNQAIQGRPDERAEAEANNAWIAADAAGKAALKRKQERDEANAKSKSNGYLGLGQSHFEFGHAAMGLQMGGDAVTGFAEKAIMENFKFEHQFAKLTGDTRLTDDDQAEIRKQVIDITRSGRVLDRSETLEVFGDLKATFGDTKDALKELPTFAKMVATLKLADMGKGGTGDIHQALSLARFIEDQGGAIDPEHPDKYKSERFDQIAQESIKVWFATQGRMAPDQWFAFQKAARSGDMTMNDHALFEETPYFATSLGPSKFGTAIMSDFQVLLAGRLDKKRELWMESVGAIKAGSGHNEGEGRNKHWVYNPNDLVNHQVAKDDIYKWLSETLAPGISNKFGFDPKTKEGRDEMVLHLTEGGQRSTIAGMWADVVRNYGVAQKEGKNIASQNGDMWNHLEEKDPMAQLANFQAAENEFLVVVGDLLQGPALSMLQEMTTTLHNFSDVLKDNPTLAADFSTFVAGVGLGMKVLGGVLMAGFFMGPVLKLVKGIGLLSGGLSKLAWAATPFGAGGEATVAMLGIVGSLSTLAAGVIMLYQGLKATSVGSQHSEDMKIGKGTEDPDRFAGFGRTPGMNNDHGGGIGGYISKLFDPNSYYHDPVGSLSSSPDRPQADSLVGRGYDIGLGTSSNPVVVHVQNQITEGSISRGVAGNMASTMNRPPSGYTGSDLRMDPLSSFYGVAQ